MRSTVLVFVCILYCCQAAAVSKGVNIDGKFESLPPVTIVTTESTKLIKGSETTNDKIGPLPPSNSTTVAPTTSTPSNTTTVTPPPSTTNATTVTPPPSTTNGTTVTTPKTPPTTTTNATTVTPPITTTNGTTPAPTKPTTAKPIPSSTTAPIISTTVVPPSNRGFDGPSFIGGIVLASGLMAIGFIALKFYRARTELNYHTL